jgi:hypothetical protein
MQPNEMKEQIPQSRDPESLSPLHEVDYRKLSHLPFRMRHADLVLRKWREIDLVDVDCAQPVRIRELQQSEKVYQSGIKGRG